jgi:hypothetical protein
MPFQARTRSSSGFRFPRSYSSCRLRTEQRTLIPGACDIVSAPFVVTRRRQEGLMIAARASRASAISGRTGQRDSGVRLAIIDP